MERRRLVPRILAQVNSFQTFAKQARSFGPSPRQQTQQPWVCQQCLYHQRTAPPRRLKPSHILRQQRRYQSSNSEQPADQPGFTSVVDNPPILVRTNRKHNYFGLALLAAMPMTAFVLGCWQVQRLGWKSDLIAKFEDRILRDPLPLPPQVDPDAIREFDYRRVYTKGKLRHDQEMLLGPRLHDGEDGYIVVTPLERMETFPGAKGNTTILVNRGWIPKDKAAHSARPEGLPQGEVVVQGLLREPLKKNMFTPKNSAKENKWYFPDVYEMAEHAGSQPVWIEETMRPDLLVTYDRITKGIPIGRPAEVNLRNKHAEYIFTWFSLAAATSVMLWMVVKKPPRTTRGVRRNTSW